MPALSELIKVFECFAPLSLAESWDKIGIQKGDIKQDIKKIMVSLNASASVLDEAIQKKCELVFCHHPLMLDIPSSIIKGSRYYGVMEKAFTEQISIYSAHTNLDKAPGGINFVLAKFLNLKSVAPLVEDVSFYKLAFFAEPKDSKKIIQELSTAGAGIIGEYSGASFRTGGTGTFFPEEGAKPSTGKIGEFNEVKEERIEMLVHSGVLDNVVSALIKAHPYEEVAYDIYPLEGMKKSYVGLGSYGILENKKTVKELAAMFDKEVNAMTRYVGDPDTIVTKVAVVAGSGARYIDIAKAKGVQLLITADVKYHDAQRADELGLNLLVLSHFSMEKLAMNLIAPELSKAIKKAGLEVEVINSQTERDVWIES